MYNKHTHVMQQRERRVAKKQLRMLLRNTAHTRTHTHTHTHTHANTLSVQTTHILLII
jgi:hypothetical protein